MSIRMPALLMMIAVTGAFALLAGCTGKAAGETAGESTVQTADPAPLEESTTAADTAAADSLPDEEPIAPEGDPVTADTGPFIDALKFHREGSWMGPWYTIQKGDDGYLCTSAAEEPPVEGLDYGDEAFEEPESADAGETASGDETDETISTEISGSPVTAKDLQKLASDLLALDILSWDGFDESESNDPGLLDGDSSFVLKIHFSDGQTVSARGYNAEPENASEVFLLLQNFFEKHEGSSAEYAREFPDSEANFLSISFAPPHANHLSRWYRLEFRRSMGRWSFLVRDPEGDFAEKGTDYGDYGDSDKELPFDTFLEILKKYHIAEWNGTDAVDSSAEEEWQITVTFENGDEFRIDTTDHPEEYEAFRKECTKAIIDFSESVKK